MNEAQLRAELDAAYSSLEKADAAGDTQAAQEIADYARSLEGRMGKLGQAQQKSRPTGPSLSGGKPGGPDIGALTKQAREAEIAGEDMTPALEAIQEAQKATDEPEVTWGDHWQSMKGSLVRAGADWFDNWAAESRQVQADTIEQMRAMQDQGDPDQQAQLQRLEQKVQSGGQVKPTFYGTFVKPFFSKDGKEPGTRIRETAEEILADRTTTAQEKARKPFINPDPAWHTRFSPSKPETWDVMFEGTAMPWEDLDAFLLAMSSNAVQLGGSIVAARTGAKAGATAKARQLRESGVVNPEVVRRQAAKTGRITGTVAASGAEYVMVRDNVHAGLQEGLRAKWDDEELWAENPRYQEMLEAGYSSEFAKQVVTDEIALAGAQVAGVTSTALGAPMNAWWAKLGLEKAAGRAGSAVKGALGEGLQEGIQEATETLVSNIHESQLDPNKPWTDDLANSFFGGWALGSGMGGGMGALSAGDTDVALNKDQKKLKKQGWTEWRETSNQRSRMSSKMRDPDYMETTTPAERAADFEQLEDLQLREAKAFKKAEPKIRQMQKKYGADAAQIRRTDRFSENAERTIRRIEIDRETRRVAEDRVATDRQLQQEAETMVQQVEKDLTSIDELTETKEALDSIAGGEIAVDQDAQQALVDQGYARWTSKAKNAAQLTPAGKVARETIPQALNSLEGKVASGFAGEDRRTALAQRQALEQMPESQRIKELHTDPVTKGPSKRKFSDTEREEGPAPAYAAVDGDSLAWVNDNMGHETGDKFLKAIASAAKKEGAELFRTGGDEFTLRADSQEEAEQVMQGIRQRLDKVTITGPEGDTIVPRITWGTGDTYALADEQANIMKEERQVRGKRAERKEPPVGYRLGGPQQDLPLMSKDELTSPEIENLAAQLLSLRGKTDEFSLRRRRKLASTIDNMQRQEEDAGLRAAAQKLEASVVENPTDEELSRRWMLMPREMQERFELRAREFYVPLIGEDISGQEVYRFESGGNREMWGRLPAYNKDLNGNVVALESSELFERLNRIIAEGTLPTDLNKQLEQDARRMQEMGMEGATATHALSQRVGNYLNGEMMIGAVTPFSGDVGTFNEAHDMYSESISPRLLLDTDPLMGPDYYDDLKKGDRVEIIVNSQSIPATVTNSDPQSVVVRWDAEAAKVLDPDTRQSGNTARFSKSHGWQGSSRLARGGTSYAKQVNSWPGQARLGRRYEESIDQWESFPDRDARIRKYNSQAAERTVHPYLRGGKRFRATKNEMRRAKDEAERLFVDYRNLPNIQLANTVADLPNYMQGQLASIGSDGTGVQGMFDEKSPKNGVWVLVGNVAKKAKDTGAPFEKLIAETLVHESIGHFGLRGYMGGDNQMDQWMDAVHRSFKKQVDAKGRSYGFLQNGKWLNEEARRLAAEEFIAEVAQHIVTDSPGYQLTKPQKNLLRQIVDYIRQWLISHNLGSVVRLDEKNIYEMIWHAQDFAQNQKGWSYRTRMGSTLVPMMKDSDIFMAAIVNEVQNGMRKTNREERNQMEKKGLAPAAEVPVFTSSMTKNSHISAFKKLVSDGRITQKELDFVDPESYLNNMTWQDWLATGVGPETLPEGIRRQFEPLRDLAYFDEAKWYAKRDALDKKWRDAESLRGGALAGLGINMDELADQARAELNEYAAAYPTDQEKSDARLALDSLMAQKPGKKAKIPRELIVNMVNRYAMQIHMRPSGGYDTAAADTDVDITPENWENLWSPHASYSGYTTRVNRRYGAYVFYQEAPQFSGAISHDFGPNNRGSFAHLRYAEADMVGGYKAYYLMEMQSDVYQGKDKAVTSENEWEALKQEIVATHGRMDAAMNNIVERIMTTWMEELDFLYRSKLEDVMKIESMADRSNMLSAWQYELTQSWRADLKNEMDRVANDIDARGLDSVYTEDARAFEYLDRQAQRDVLGMMLAMSVEFATYNYDPEQAGGDPIDDAETLRAHVKSRFRGKLDYSYKPQMARLVANPRLLQEVLDRMELVVGKKLDANNLINTAQNETKSVEVTIPAEFMGWVSSTMPGVTSADGIVQELLNNNRDVITSLGWNVDLMQVKNNTDGTATISTYGGVAAPSEQEQDRLFEDEIDFGTALKSAIVAGVRGKMSSDWEAEERARIRRVERQLAELRSGGQQLTSDKVEDFLNEIEWDTGDVGWAEYIDEDWYADWKTRAWINRHREAGELADEIDVEQLTDDEGTILDRNHPEYRAALEFDDDGDVDNEAAEEWLIEERDKIIEEYWEQGGDGWDQKIEEFEQEFHDRYSATDEWVAKVPIGWDEDGNVTNTMDVEVAHNQRNEEVYSWDSDPINDSYEIRIDDPVDFWDTQYDEDSAYELIYNRTAAYLADNDITPPATSVFFSAPDPQAEAELREMAKPKPPPDYDGIARDMERTEFEARVQDSKKESFAKQWESVIRLQRRLDQDIAPPSPMQKLWQEVAVKFSIADAIRKGYDSVVWQGGEASMSRGGWGHPSEYVKQYSWVEYEKVDREIQGETRQLYQLSFPDGSGLLMDPARMPIMIGNDVASEIMRRAEEGLSQEQQLSELRNRIRIVPAGRQFLVIDSKEQYVIHKRDTALTAENTRVQVIEEMLENNVQSGKGRLNGNEIGGMINVAKRDRVSSGYVDTFSVDSKLMGARTGYDVVIPSLANKIARRYGGKVTEGGIDLGERETEELVLIEGGRRYNVDSKFFKDYPNLRWEKIEGLGWLALSDNGVVSGEVHRVESLAEAEVVEFTQRGAGAFGIKVYELKITGEMREAFGNGKIPIMSNDPVDSSPTLKEFAKKVGAVPNRLTLGQRWDQWRKDAKARLNQNVFDRFYGIKYAMERAAWQGPVEKDPYVSTRLTTSLDSQMRAVMNYGYPVWNDGMMDVGGDKGLLDILAPVSDPQMMRAWSLYMVARRSERLMAEGRESLVTAEEIKEGIALAETYPVFEVVAREYAEFNKKVLDFAEQAGMIDPESRAVWEHADYVPFYRVVDDRVTGALAPGVGVANQRKPIRQLKGGEQAISDIPTNIIQNITQLIDGSTKNQAALLAVDALKGTGIIHKIPGLQPAQELMPMGQLKTMLIQNGLNPDVIPEEALKGMRKMTVMKPPTGEGVFTVMRDGKREVYQTGDRLLFDAMTQINKKQFGKWISLFRGPKRFLTAAVTLDPGFMMANYMRDLLSSFVQSRDIGPLNLPSHMLRSVQGMKQAMMKDESYRTMMSAGAAFDSGYINYGDPNSVHRAIRKAQRKKGFRVSVLDGPARIYEFYKELGAAVENSNRIAVYNEAIAAGKSKKQAAFEAKDLMDFSMGGSLPAVQFLIQTVPFFGARLQGLHRLGRGFADDPLAFAAKGLMLSMAGMALYLQYADDERYKELEEWDKDTYYHFWIGDKHYRIPKPFEVGAVFNTIPERAFEYAYNEANDAEKLLMQRFGHMLAETFAFNPIPQLAMPATENAFNYNFFTGRQIVSPFAEKTMAPEQYRHTTSPTLVEIARALPEGLDKINKKYRSPLYLENLYRGYMGTLGRYALMAADEITRDVMGKPDRPSMQPADYPVLGRFYRGTEDMPRRTKYEEGFYTLLREVGDIQGSLRKLEKEGDEARMEALAARKEPYIGLSRDLENARRDISDLNADAQSIWNDENLSPEDKRKVLDEIQGAKNEIFKAIHEIRPGGDSDKGATKDDLTFLIQRFGVDETASRIEKTRPATASLMRDLTQLNQEEKRSLVR